MVNEGEMLVVCELSLLRELRNYLDDFCNFHRMPEETFIVLLNLLEHRLQRQETLMKGSITPREQLIAILRFVAKGYVYKDLKFPLRIKWKNSNTGFQIAHTRSVRDAVFYRRRSMPASRLGPTRSSDSPAKKVE